MAPEVSRDQVLAVVRARCAEAEQPTMEDLASAAGIALRTLYRMFGSRQTLLREAGCLPQPTTRQYVLDAALAELEKRGLAELSMDHLAVTASISRATLYRLFPGKAALFAELIETFSPWEPVADVLDDLAQAPADETIPAVAQALAGAMEDRIGVLLRMVLELRRGDPDTAEAVQRSMARGLPDLSAYLEREMLAGRLRQMHPVLALQLLAGPIMAHLLTRPLAEQVADFPVSQPIVLDEIVRAWLRAMSPPSGSRSPTSDEADDRLDILSTGTEPAG